MVHIRDKQPGNDGKLGDRQPHAASQSLLKRL
jgi:hypothetical protein